MKPIHIAGDTVLGHLGWHEGGPLGRRVGRLLIRAALFIFFTMVVIWTAIGGFNLVP